MYTDRDIEITKDVVVVPPEFSMSANQIREDRFLTKDNQQGGDLMKLALWLAEKRASFNTKTFDKDQMSENDRLWKYYTDSLPTIEEYKERGFPLVAENADLLKLRGVPIVGKIADWSLVMKQMLMKEVVNYNNKRGSRPLLTMDDALWAQTSVANRVYECKGLQLVPIADSFNHASGESTLYPMCQERDGLVWLTAKRHINKGEELTTDYSETREDDPGVDLIIKHGLFDGGVRERWSNEECRKIAGALGGDADHGSPMMRTLGQLTKLSCSDGEFAGTDYHERLKWNPGKAPKAAQLPVLVPPGSFPSRKPSATGNSRSRVSRAHLLDFL